MGEMFKAKYVGPRQELMGRTALVYEDPVTQSLWLAQFDDANFEFPELTPWAFGWHLFERSDFVPIFTDLTKEH